MCTVPPTPRMAIDETHTSHKIGVFINKSSRFAFGSVISSHTYLCAGLIGMV